MKTYGKRYKQGFIIEEWENEKNLSVKSKKRERQKAKLEIEHEIYKEEKRAKNLNSLQG